MKFKYLILYIILSCIINYNYHIGWKEIVHAKPLIVLPLAYTFISIPIIGSIVYYIYKNFKIITSDDKDEEKLYAINNIDKEIIKLEKSYALLNKYFKNNIININKINEKIQDLYLTFTFIIKNNSFLNLINDDQKKFIDEFTIKNNSIHQNDAIYVYRNKELILSVKDLFNDIKKFIDKEDKRDAKRLIKLNLKDTTYKFNIKEINSYEKTYNDFEKLINDNKNLIDEIIKVYINKFGILEINKFISKIKNESPEIDSLIIFQDKELLDKIEKFNNYSKIFSASLGLATGAIFINNKYNNYKRQMKAKNKEKEIGFGNFIKESTKNLFKRKK